MSPVPVRFMNGAYVLMSDGWAVPGVTMAFASACLLGRLLTTCSLFVHVCAAHAHSLSYNGDVGESVEAQLRKAGGDHVNVTL